MSEIAMNQAIASKKRKKRYDFASQIRLSQYAITADRKNRIESLKNGVSGKVLDKQQVRAKFLMDKEQRHVMAKYKAMQRSSGNSAVAEAPSGPNDVMLQNAPILRGHGHMTDKRLQMWRLKELDLQQQLQNSIKPHEKTGTVEELLDTNDPLNKQVMDLMVSIGYTFADIEKIVLALKEGKQDMSDEKTKESWFVETEQIDVFETLRSQLPKISKDAIKFPSRFLRDSQQFNIESWQHALLNLYVDAVTGRNRDVHTKDVEQASTRTPTPQSEHLAASEEVFLPKLNATRTLVKRIDEENYTEIETYKPTSSMVIVGRYGGDRKVTRPQTTVLTTKVLEDMKPRSRSHSMIPSVVSSNDEVDSYSSPSLTVSNIPGIDLPLCQTQPPAEHVTTELPTITVTDDADVTALSEKLFLPNGVDAVAKQHQEQAQWFSMRQSSLSRKMQTTSSSRESKMKGHQAAKNHLKPISRWERDLMAEAPQGLYSHRAPVKVTLARSKSQRDNDLKDLVEKNTLKTQMEQILTGEHTRQKQARIKLVKTLMKIEDK